MRLLKRSTCKSVYSISAVVTAVVVVVTTVHAVKREHSHTHTASILRTQMNTSCATIIASCQLTPSRVHTFADAMHSWIKVKGVGEIIVVDWGSSVSAISVMKSIGIPSSARAKNIRVYGSGSLPWRIGAAFNLGLAYALCPKILKVDCDTYLHEDFLLHNQIESVGFRYGDYMNADADENDKHLNGVFFARTSDLRYIHGFDERFSLYGWDDSDLYFRLESYLIRRNITPPYADFKRYASAMRLIRHLAHERARHAYEAAGICFNEAASKMVPRWQDRADEIAHGFKCQIERPISGIDVHGCKIERTPLTLQALLDTNSCLNVFETCRRKHDNFIDVDPPCNPNK